MGHFISEKDIVVMEALGGTHARTHKYTHTHTKAHRHTDTQKHRRTEAHTATHIRVPSNKSGACCNRFPKPEPGRGRSEELSVVVFWLLKEE